MICSQLDLKDFRSYEQFLFCSKIHIEERNETEASRLTTLVARLRYSLLEVWPVATARLFPSFEQKRLGRSLEAFFFNAKLSQRALVLDYLEIREIAVVLIRI